MKRKLAIAAFALLVAIGCMLMLLNAAHALACTAAAGMVAAERWG